MLRKRVDLPGAANFGADVVAGETLKVGGVDLSTGKLKIALNGTNTQKLAVTSSATLTNATLSLGIASGLSSGSFTILTANSITGTFGTILVNGLPNGANGTVTVTYPSNKSVLVTITRLCRPLPSVRSIPNRKAQACCWHGIAYRIPECRF